MAMKAIKNTPPDNAIDIQSDAIPKNLSILRMPQLIKKVGLSKNAIKARIAAGEFPKPVNLGGGRSVGFYAHEVDQWLLSLSRVN